MYYRRYFAGTIASNTQCRSAKVISTGGNTQNYYNQTDVLLSAIKQTLEDMGIQCEYGNSDGILVIDGCTVQLLVSSSNSYILININGLQCANLTNSSYLPFSGLNYKFYVTLKGDIDGILKICIGAYSSPQYEQIGFAIGKGTDLRDNTEIRVVTASLSNLTVFNVLKNDRILQEYTGTIYFGWIIQNLAALNNSGAEVTLVECVAQPGRFKLNNCYFGNASLTNDTFYNIGGDIYYAISSNILVKCVNDQAL